MLKLRNMPIHERQLRTLNDSELQRFHQQIKKIEKDMETRVAERAEIAPPLDDVHSKHWDDPVFEKLVFTLRNVRELLILIERELASRPKQEMSGAADGLPTG